MATVTALFLVTALTAYVVFGGADFGGGILEATLPHAGLKARLQKVIAPVWEANHVWLIAVVVILFVGFPRVYTGVLTRLYLPVSLALMAILVRGACFTLRKYDPSPGGLSQVYSVAFRASSAVAPFAFGLIVAGLLSEHPALPTKLDDTSPGSAGYDYYDFYVAPWWGVFAVLCGLFIAALFAYVAAVFFYGEVHTAQDRALIVKRIYAFLASTFVLGGAVLLTGHLTQRVPLAAGLHPIQISCQLLAAAGLFSLVRAIRRKRVWAMRFSVGAQVLAILGGWFSAQYPILLKVAPEPLTLHNAAAPAVTLLWLNLGLVIVLSLVVPLLVVLYRVFRASDGNPPE